MNDSIWLILWIGAKKKKEKTIQWRFYVRINRSSNPNWSEVRTILQFPWNTKEREREKKISRFNQILSTPFSLSFFLPTVFIRRQSGWVSRNFQRRENCNKGRGKGFISDLQSLRIWDVAEGRGMVSWEEQGMILLAGISQEKFTFLKYRIRYRCTRMVSS